MPILLKLFHKLGTEIRLPNSFYKATVTLTYKSQKDLITKDNYRPISFMNIEAKYSVKYLQTKSKNTSKRSSTMNN